MTVIDTIRVNSSGYRCVARATGGVPRSGLVGRAKVDIRIMT